MVGFQSGLPGAPAFLKRVLHVSAQGVVTGNVTTQRLRLVAISAEVPRLWNNRATQIVLVSELN